MVLGDGSAPPAGMAVLVLDGSDSSRRRLVLDLGRHFDRVEGAATGNDGLLRLQAGSFDAVALDPSLPDVSGMELIPILRHRHPLLRIVVVTGHGSVASCVRSIKLGAADYLITPVPAARIPGGPGAQERNKVGLLLFSCSMRRPWNGPCGC